MVRPSAPHSPHPAFSRPAALIAPTYLRNSAKFYHAPRVHQVQQFQEFQQFQENLDIHDGYWHHHRQHHRR